MHLTASEIVMDCMCVDTQRIPLHAIFTIMASTLCGPGMIRVNKMELTSEKVGQRLVPP